MFIELEKDLEVFDASSVSIKHHKIQPGKHNVEIIPIPIGYGGSDWVVLVGTKIGASLAYFEEVGVEIKE